jgi:hypothetical protein
MEVKCSSKAIYILSPPTTIPCLLRGNVIEALDNPTAETNIMLEFFTETILGNMSLVSTNKLFKSPSGLIFEYCGIARAMPIKIDEIEVHLDFHIYAILDFDLLIGYPSEFFFHKNLLMGALRKKMLLPLATKTQR